MQAMRSKRQRPALRDAEGRLRRQDIRRLSQDLTRGRKRTAYVHPYSGGRRS